MTTEAAGTHAAHGVHHWEWSWAPMAAAFGLLFLVPMTFSFYFVYESPLAAIVCAGIGTPLLLAGVARWVEEGLTQKPLMAGLAAIGLPVFIVSEIFIFLGLFATYWTMRLSADVWPPAGTPVMPTLLPVFMTVVLVSSSITIHKGEEKLDQGDMAGFRQWLWITIGLGLLFLSCTIYEYAHLVQVGFVPGTNAFSTSFFTITGFHASHVLVGVGVFIAVLIPALGGRSNHTLVQCASIYWHFVDIVWFFVVSQIYFW